MALVKVAGIQCSVHRDLKENLPAILEQISWAGSQHARFVLFPEMALTGYHGDFAQSEIKDAQVLIAEAAREHSVCVLVGTGAKEGPSTYIQVRIVDREGSWVGQHSKMVPTSGDREWCRPGEELRLFQAEGLAFGVLICNDLWVTPGCGPYPDPRLCYQLGERGAQAVFHAINSGSSPEHIPYHEANLALRARESKLHIITANAAVDKGGVNCATGVMGPDGHWLVRCPRQGEQRFVADIDVKPTASA